MSTVIENLVVATAFAAAGIGVAGGYTQFVRTDADYVVEDFNLKAADAPHVHKQKTLERSVEGGAVGLIAAAGLLALRKRRVQPT